MATIVDELWLDFAAQIVHVKWQSMKISRRRVVSQRWKIDKVMCNFPSMRMLATHRWINEKKFVQWLENLWKNCEARKWFDWWIFEEKRWMLIKTKHIEHLNCRWKERVIVDFEYRQCWVSHLIHGVYINEANSNISRQRICWLLNVSIQMLPLFGWQMPDTERMF